MFLIRATIVSLLLLGVYTSYGQETYPNNGVKDVRPMGHVFMNLTAFNGRGDTLDSVHFVIRNGKIESVGPESPDSGLVVHDCSGLFLYPSFIDAFAVVKTKKKQGRSGGADFKTAPKEASNWNPAIHPEYEHKPTLPLSKKERDPWLASGIGIISMHKADGIMRGQPAVFYLGIDQANDAVIAPSNSVHYFSFNKGSSSFDYPSSHMGAIALIRQTFYDAQWYHSGGSEIEFNPSLRALEGIDNSVNVFDIGSSLSVRNTSMLSDEFGLSFILKGSGKEYLVLDDIPEKTRFILPTTFPKALRVEDPFDARVVSLGELKHWELAPYNVRILSEAGHDIALTRDTNKSPKEFFNGLRRIHATGVSHADIVKMLSSTPAKYLGLASTTGDLAPGLNADFFISNAPITDESFQVLEHWGKGKRVYQKSIVNQSLSGKYSLVVDGDEMTLEVSVTQKGITSKLLNDDSRTVKIIPSGNLITLIISNNDEKVAAEYRLSGKLSFGGSVWDGQGQNEKGEWIEWGAIKNREKHSNALSDSIEKDSIPEIPMMTFPNQGYGWDSLWSVDSYVLTNATVWTCSDTGTLSNADIWVENGKIKAVGSGRLYPEGLKRINLNGRHITPGIIDEHSHIGIRGGVNEWAQSSSAEVRISDAIDPWNVNFYRQLAGGVTSAQLLHGSANPIGGQSALIKFKWGQTADEMLIDEAPGFIKFALGENVKRSNRKEHGGRFPLTRMGVEQSFVDAFSRAEAYSYSPQSTQPSKRNKPSSSAAGLARKDLELEAVKEILDSMRFISCHSYVQSEILMLMSVGDSFGFTVNTFTHILEGYKVAPEMVAHGANGSTFSDWWAYKFEVNDAIPYNAALMTRVGVNTAINSDDAEMGRRLNQEAAKAIKYGGLSEEEALNLVTINPAKMLHLDDRVGSIEIGKDADLVVWSGHPLSMTTKADQTYIEGVRYFDRSKLADQRKQMEMERARLINLMLEDKSSNKKSVKHKEKHEYHCDTVLDKYWEE